jgi:undecaprenyl-diphosphatase
MRALRRLERHELTWLAVGFGACLFLLLFVLIASEVVEGDTQALDIKVVQAFRNAADPARPIGPEWLEFSVIDLTSLGSFTVLAVVVLAVTGFLVLQSRYRTALFVAATMVSGEFANFILKHLFNRPRPTVVPELRVVTPSFPSGHAMESAIVYLTLGAVLMRVAERRPTKIYCLAVAVLLTVLVGLSRVYLGVHYPSDVIAGWTVGFLWAAICWMVAERFERPTIDAERARGTKSE